ncbi:MAG: Minf_1886 family protein [Verrucomicrobiota bacterium]
MEEHEHRDAIQHILKQDERFARQAYAFVQESVSFATRKRLHQQESEEHHESTLPRHISGQKLLEAMRTLALRQYGPLAHDVLAEWGIHKCTDFGAIVFLLVEHELLGASEEDSIEDFADGYDFRDAFLAPYAPPDTETDKPTPIY